MNLNELIEKYKGKIELRKKQILFIEGTELHFLTDDLILNLEETLSDLEHLKEIVSDTLFKIDTSILETEIAKKEIIGE